jgi:hypothetical protein
MGKVVKIEGKKFSGNVMIYDGFTLPQVELVEGGIASVNSIEVDEKGRYKMSDRDKPIVPVILECVEKWTLTNFPEKPTLDNFPMTPRKEAHALITSIWNAIVEVYNGEQEVPNE